MTEKKPGKTQFDTPEAGSSARLVSSADDESRKSMASIGLY